MDGRPGWKEDPEEIDEYKDWPTCTVGCIEFPILENYREIDDTPLLPTNLTKITKEYVCSIRYCP